MSRPAIAIRGIGKKYRLGRSTQGRSFRDAFGDAFASTFRRIKGFGEDRARSDDFWALRDVSFEIKPGEAVGILGRNGAGKSTLLKILSQITEPTEGEAHLRGRVGSLLEVGTGFHPDLTGRENIFLNGAILGMRRAEIRRRFDEIVAFAEIERFLDTPVKRYSSGMYIRLAFAVAAHLEPEILLVDEILSVGDIQFQKKCLGKMNDVTSQGRTVFFVSHNMQSIAALTSRCLVFKSGRLVDDAPTAEAIQAFVEMSVQGTELGQPYVNRGGDPAENYVAEARVVTSETAGQQVWGEPIAFEFTLHVGRPVDRLCFFFAVANNMGVVVTCFSMFDEGMPFRTKAGDYRLRCEVPRFHLYQGSYTLTTYILESRGHATLERVSEICPFDVTMGSLTRNGFEWYRDMAVFLEDVQWHPIVEI